MLKCSPYIFVIFGIINGTYAIAADQAELIPRDLTREPSVDLEYEGRIVSREWAHCARLAPEQRSGCSSFRDLPKHQLDLSTLNPDQKEGLWRDLPIQPYDSASDAVDMKEGDIVYYKNDVFSRKGKQRFRAGNSRGEVFTVVFGTEAHTILLRRAYLRKLGYRVPAAKWLSRVVVHFAKPLAKPAFIKRADVNILRNVEERWIVKAQDGGYDDDSDHLMLQDVVVKTDDDFDLSMGAMTAANVQGRRTLRSLLVPYSVLFVGESIPLLPWHVGRIENDQIQLQYYNPGDFFTAWEDAKWIARRMARLTRKDYEEVVASAAYPPPVAALLLERLCARHNSALELIGIEAAKLEVNGKVSLPPELVDGKLVKEFFPGHGARYSYPDPESPLSMPEIWGLGYSILQTNVLHNIESKLNEQIPHFDVAKIAQESALKDAERRFIKFLETGEPLAAKFRLFVAPIGGINVIADREIVAGTYMGTDNVLQTAHTIGLGAYGGIFVGAENLPTPWFASGKAVVNVNRTYTHLQPIMSIRKGAKQSFKNLLVPWTKKKTGSVLDELETLPEEGKERQKALDEMVGKLKEALSLGESFITTDFLGGEVSVRGGASFEEQVRAYAEMKAKAIVLSRLHINRSGEDAVDIYRDLGDARQLGISLNLEAYIPIVKLYGNIDSGTARTKMYKININPNEKINPEIVRNLAALRAAILHNSTELARKVSKPWEAKTKFTDKDTGVNFLMWRWRRAKMKGDITLTHPTGESTELYRLAQSTRSGKNFEALATQGINAAIRHFIEDGEAAIAERQVENVAYTIGGSSEIREVNFEGIKEKNGKSMTFKDPYVELIYRWQGFRMGGARATDLIDVLNSEYDFQFFDPLVFNDTLALLFFSIELRFFFAHGAFARMAALTDDQALALFLANNKKTRESVAHQLPQPKSGTSSFPGEDPWGQFTQEEQRWAICFLDAKKDYLKNTRKGKAADAAQNANDMVSCAERFLNVEGVLELVGGKENVYGVATIRGFREGDPNGDDQNKQWHKNLVSNAFGTIGNDRIVGPVTALRQINGFAEGEFMGYWMRRRP